jgi:monofunctional glycosyltransferase
MISRKPGSTARRKLFSIRGILVRTLQIPAILLIFSILATFALRWLPLPTTAVMVERRLDAWRNHRAYRMDYRWTSLKQISPSAALAVIAAEDQNFMKHHGFDYESIQKALEAHERGRRLRGASTISQQVAKNVFLWSGRSLVRKGIEAYFTVLIELLWPKRRIVEVYLNIVELGDGRFGVEAASRHFFNKSAKSLSPEEASLLAAVLPNPLRLKAGRPSEYVRARQAWILQQMQNLENPAFLKRLEK